MVTKTVSSLCFMIDRIGNYNGVGDGIGPFPFPSALSHRSARRRAASAPHNFTIDLSGRERGWRRLFPPYYPRDICRIFPIAYQNFLSIGQMRVLRFSPRAYDWSNLNKRSSSPESQVCPDVKLIPHMDPSSGEREPKLYMQSSSPVSFARTKYPYIFVSAPSWHNQIHVEHIDLRLHRLASCRLIASSQTMQLGTITSVVSIGCTWMAMETTAAINSWFSNFREHRLAPLGIRLWLVKSSSHALLQLGAIILTSPTQGIFGTAQAQEYFSAFFNPSTAILGAIISTVRCRARLGSAHSIRRLTPKPGGL